MTSRLIVSFIGKTDLGCFGLIPDYVINPDDQSPVLRLLLHLAGQGACPLGQTRLLLFDDQPHNDLRRRWCEQLRTALPQIGLGGLPVELRPAVLPAGPNDVQALYEVVFNAVPTARPDATDEVLFHLSSGAWGMQSTLMLAACCLPLKKARMFETSKERPVREVQLPVVLFARDARHHLPGRARLAPGARSKLLPNTVVDDPTVEAAYAMLAGAAAQRGAQSLLIQGPTGSGKWHAARQFAHWRETQAVLEWLHPGIPVDEVSGASTVLIWRLDAWDAAALQALSAWRAAHPDVSVVATWRTDMPAAAAMHEVARAGLRGAVFVTLPALSARTDIVELGKAVARQAGIFDGKVAGRLQYVLGADVYGHNLHDLKQVLVTTSLHSSGQYPDERGWLRAAQIIDAAQGEALLREASDTLANLRFGPGRPGLNLDDTLKLVQSLVVKAALARGLTQAQAGTLLGYTQTGISEIVNRELELKHWQTPVTPITTALPRLDPPNATA